MSETRREILRLLQKGKLTSDQAMDLLQAMEPSPQQQDEGSDSDEALTGELIFPSSPPDMDRFRRLWQYPFFIAVSAVLLTGLVLQSIYDSSGGTITFWFVCVWSIFVSMLVLAALAFLSRRGTWLHVRVSERRGKRIAISLPLPLGLASWALGIARGFVGDANRQKIDAASEFLNAARENLRASDADPLVINVNDGDGDQVQVFIG